MARFHLPPEAWSSEPALTGDEARHLSQVLRIRAGETINVFDGTGTRATAEVISVSRDRVPLCLGEPIRRVLPGPHITLVQAITKGKTMDLIVQKAVELGVNAIQPIVTKNTVVQPGEGKSEKWRRTALEACKQCGQDTLPSIAEPLVFHEWLESCDKDGLKLIASLTDSAKSMRNILRDNQEIQNISLLVGPEGDFTDKETELSLNKGFIPITFGPIVLRAETAALFGLSALRYEFW